MAIKHGPTLGNNDKPDFGGDIYLAIVFPFFKFNHFAMVIKNQPIRIDELFMNPVLVSRSLFTSYAFLPLDL